MLGVLYLFVIESLVFKSNEGDSGSKDLALERNAILQNN
jgi:hypothetical protein